MNDATLRDGFAMAALQGELASQAVDIGIYRTAKLDGLASRVFKIADAMLLERSKE